MAQLNKVFQIGNLTRDVEVRYTPGGLTVGKFSIAVNERFKSGDEWKEEVSYFDITTFGKIAEVCAEHIGKGSPVLVYGRLKQNRWETEDGQKRSKIEIIAESVQFLGKKGEAKDDDIPF
jgi:single-strand DNA-binding protein